MDNKNISTRLAKYKSLLRSSRKDELKNPNSTSKVKIAMLKKNYSRKINDGKENYQRYVKVNRKRFNDEVKSLNSSLIEKKGEKVYTAKVTNDDFALLNGKVCSLLRRFRYK